MDRMNETVFTPTITYGKTRTLDFVSKGKLAPISSKKRAAKRAVYEKKQLGCSRSKESATTFSCKTDKNLPLPPIFPGKLSAVPVILEKEEKLTTRSSIFTKTDNRDVKDQSNLPSISCRSRTKNNLVIEPNISSTMIPSETEQIPLSLESIIETPANDRHSNIQSQIHFLHPFMLVWLNSDTTNSTLQYNHSISQLRQVIDTIHRFTDPQKCIDFLREKINEKIFLIISINNSPQSTISQIHHLSQLHAIYIYGETKPKYQQWIKIWPKIKGIFIDVNKIRRSLQQETQHCRRDSLAISIPSVRLDRLDSSYMYTQLLKEVILEMEDGEKAKNEFIQYCRQSHIGTLDRRKIIDEFEEDYHKYTPIWWYTRDCFVSDMVNQALRLQEINTIIRTRFFIRELHEQIKRLYEPPSAKFTLYRGQGLSYGDFQQLCTLKGGLYSFHSFLSTSADREIAWLFASSSKVDPNLIGIIFHINVDPASLISALYASSDKMGYYKTEKEVLFSMHTIFRVGEIKELEDRLWQVELSLTSDDDKDLQTLTENIREATQGTTGWDRLGQLLLKMGKFDKVKEIYDVLIENSSKDDMKGLAHHYHLLGSVQEHRHNYEDALAFYMKTLEIYQSLPGSNPLDCSTLYNDIGSVHQHKREYSKALNFHEMALDIQSQSTPLNHADLVITYGHLARTHQNMGYYSKALEFYQKKLDIHQKSKPLNYLNLAITYENIAEMHYNMGEYSEALKLFRKVFKIRQHSFHRNNTEIAISCNNIGKVHEKTEEYARAIEYYQYARDILGKSIPVNFSELAMTCEKIARIYKKMAEPLEALTFYQEALRNLERSSNSVEMNVASIHDSIGQISEDIGDYKQAIYSYRQAIQIGQKLLSQNNCQYQLYENHLANTRKKLKHILSFSNFHIFL